MPETSAKIMSIGNDQRDRQLNSQFVNVINAQAKLIKKLMQNQSYLLENIRVLAGNSNGSTQNYFSNNENIAQNKLEDESFYKIKLKQYKTPKNKSKKHQQIKVLHRQSFQSQHSSSSILQHSEDSQFKVTKISQTKNVIKNFAKSLFRFMMKHRVYVGKVLDRLDIKQEDFHQIFKKFKGKIYSISQLKNLWLPEGNEFHKAFRIVSMEYLRKHNLDHIFNSRVINYKTHLKYRNKMCAILQNPSQFISIKLD